MMVFKVNVAKHPTLGSQCKRVNAQKMREFTIKKKTTHIFVAEIESSLWLAVDPGYSQVTINATLICSIFSVKLKRRYHFIDRMKFVRLWSHETECLLCIYTNAKDMNNESPQKKHTHTQRVRNEKEIVCIFRARFSVFLFFFLYLVSFGFGRSISDLNADTPI